MKFKLPFTISEALRNLQPGESLLIPCNGKTVQSTQSSINSMLPKQGLQSRDYSQRKALIIQDEHHSPSPVIIVTRAAAEVAGAA